ncbi:MAG: MFS transporter [Actinomycetota bacterium]
MTASTLSTPELPLTNTDPPQLRPGRWLDDWDPEDAGFWAKHGRRIARRNLVLSVYAEFIGFAVWAVWSVVVPQLNSVGFSLSIDQMFWLVSVPSLVGAVLRIPYTFAVPIFGGRNWTIISALLLIVPATGLTLAVSNPDTSFGVLLAVAALAGFGGGNFASSMANISFFFPEKEKGKALGFNAAGGNIGTAAVQFAVPLLVTIGAGITLERAGLVFIPLTLLAAFLAWRYMDNLSAAKADYRSFARATREPHTWLLSFLYIGTFGSFIGYSVAFPTLLKTQFPEVGLKIAFAGALVGSLIRPVGGILADRFGGAVITMGSYLTMAVGAVGAIIGLAEKSFGIFLGSFLLLFLASGAGNGSLYRMIPAVFRGKAEGADAAGLLTSRKAAAGCIGISGAIGAVGGFLVPRGFAWSTSATGGLRAALVVFICIYLVMIVVTWAVYRRRSSRFGALRV